MFQVANALLLVDFVTAFLVTYRISWVANRTIDYPPRFEAMRPRGLTFYYVLLAAQFLSLACIAAHIGLVIVTAWAPGSSVFFLAAAVAMLAFAAFVLFRFPGSP